MKPRTKSAMWIIALTAPSILGGSMCKGQEASCNSASPDNSVTTTTPATGGDPGVFGAVGNVTAPAAQSPTQPTPDPILNPGPNPVDAIQDQIKQVEDSIFNAADAPTQLEFQHRLDALLAQLAAVQQSIDAANQAAAAQAPPVPPDSSPPPPPPPTPKPPNRDITNDDLSNIGSFFSKKKPQAIKQGLDAVDNINTLKNLFKGN